jgi:hypothetical protein
MPTAQDNVDGAKVVQKAMHAVLDSVVAGRSGPIVAELAADIASEQLKSIDDLVTEYERDVTASRKASGEVAVVYREAHGVPLRRQAFVNAGAAEAWLDNWCAQNGRYPTEVRWT